MLDKIRVVTVVGILVLFTISVFTQYPIDPGTRTTLGALALAAAGFLFGPTLLRRNKEER
jgi:hypothetical protein